MRALLMIGMMACLCATDAVAHSGDVYLARPAGDVKVDGVLSDWPDDAFTQAPYYGKELDTPNDRKDFSATYAIAWSEDLVYVAARVSDDRHVNQLDIFANEGDRVSFAFRTRHHRYAWNAGTNVSRGRRREIRHTLHLVSQLVVSKWFPTPSFEMKLRAKPGMRLHSN